MNLSSLSGRDAAATLLADTTDVVKSLSTYIDVPDEEEVHDRVEKLGRMGKAVTEHVQDMARLVQTEDVAEVHFLGQDLKIDDADATVVIIFPRGKPNGPVDGRAQVQQPIAQAHKIFERQHNHASAETMNAGFESFGHGGPVSQSHYQKVVRSKLLHLFRASGLKVVTFPSIDGDEVFAKISLDIGGEVIRQLAQRFSYTMPFTPEAYKDVHKHGIYQGHRPMYRDNQPVPAYGPYQKEVSASMGAFRPVDEIRIVEMQLHSLVSLEQLKKQGVITKCFAAARHADIQNLHRDWLQNSHARRLSPVAATCTALLEMPPYQTKSGCVRNYFGEEIAFFFRWLAFYTHMLAYLGALGVAFHFLQGLGEEVRHVLHICFAAIMVTWASVFNQLFRNRMARSQQDWGMKDFELAFLSFDRADYDPEQEGSWRQGVKRTMSVLMCVLFCVMFIGVISFIEERKKEQKEDAGSNGVFFKNHGSLIVVSTIKVWSIAWGYIAPLLAEMQNHRTQARFDDALTSMLAMVKIFVTLWNFVYVAFVRTWTSPTCAGSLEEAAGMVWASSDFAAAGPELRTRALEELGMPHFSYLRNSTTAPVCVRGCFPATPALSVPGGETNCHKILRYELVIFFFVHIVYTVVFLLYPMVKVKIDMFLEVQRARSQRRDGETSQWRYSWLQFQAKCPPYEYASWGGSRVEDFLECAIGFALITCFGILFPMLSFLAFLANLVEYRLYAYRMTHVTCRPFPRGASGIGSWQSVFEAISGVSVVANVLLMTFVMHPMRSMTLPYQLGFFIVLEHVLLGIRGFIDYVIPEEPHDVRQIEDFNMHFRKTMVKYPPLEVPNSERYENEYKDVDFGLRPGDGLELTCDDFIGPVVDEDGSDSELLGTSEDFNSSFRSDEQADCCAFHQPSFRPL